MHTSTVLRRVFALVRNTLWSIALVLAAVVPLGSARAGPGLLASDANFKLLASAGFTQAIDGAHPEGSTLNIYSWSMAWYKGKLYVGTLRNQNDGTLASLSVDTGQIWAYTPGGADGSNGTWALALQSPMLVPGIPRDFGYRWMTVCNFNGQDTLFISTLGFLQGNILWTRDGVTFTPVTRTGFPTQTVGFRTISCFKEASGKQMLAISPVGLAGNATTFDSDLSGNPIVLVNDDPLGRGTWRNYSPLQMNDPNNNAFFTIYAAPNGMLYAGVDNFTTGAQVWKTAGCPTYVVCVPSWTKVIDLGAGRPLAADGSVQNTGVSDMMAYGDSIYMGVDVPTNKKPPAEMWRLRMSDDQLTIVMGDPRLNFGTGTVPTNPAYPTNLRCGVPLEDIDGGGTANDCPPTSRRGAGFGPIGSAATGYPSGTNAYFWRLLNYVYNPATAPLGDNRLYAGTLDQARNKPGAVPGFDIITTTDGTNWNVITNDGLGDPTALGMRAIASSPIGLFVGSAARGNPPYGTSVWVGIPQPDTTAPTTTIASPPSPVEGATVNAHNVDFAWSATDAPPPGNLPITYAYRLDPIEPAFPAFSAATAKSYTNLVNGTYTFYVIAKDAVGNTETPGAAAGASNRRTFTISAPDLPPTVTIQSAPATPNPTGNVAFSWTGSDDLTPTASLVYDFWLAPAGADPNSFNGATSATYNGLADGAYTFHVKAKDAAGNVGAEATASFTVAHPAGPPASPAPASAAGNGPGVIRVTWTDVPGETGFSVQRCVGLRCLPIGSLPAGVTFVNDVPGGTAGTIYTYRVQACNPLGCSAPAVTNSVALP